MERLPRISVVTSSYNQGKYIGETIDSVLGQAYPNLEHIIVDGMSKDHTPEVLSRYSHLDVIRELDNGQADAINKGFKIATGDILCFLNSDDTLEPGALHRVAQEIDPQRERHVVMGRCRFIDERGRYTGIEHPSAFAGFERMLAIWKGHTIPQPAVFWTREVWERCGPMSEGLVLDYDLFCRFARSYRFHCVDQVFATYRLHQNSKTVGASDSERLKQSVAVSRQYWGSAFSPAYWRLALSLFAYHFDRVGRSRRLLAQASSAWQDRRIAQAAPLALAAGILAPEVAFYVGVYPRLKDSAGGALKAALDRVLRVRGAVDPQTSAYLNRTELWPDGWAGPHLKVELTAAGGERKLLLQGWIEPKYVRGPMTFRTELNGKEVGVLQANPANFFLEYPLPDSLEPGTHSVVVHTVNYFVPHRLGGGGDYRPLSWRPLPDGQGVLFR